MVGAARHWAVLAQGCFTLRDAKTAVGVLRYRADRVAAVIDSTRAGLTAEACVGTGGAVPVVASLDEAAARGARALVIGIAPQGGGFPEEWRLLLREALARGWDVISGLHTFLGDDPELAGLARRHGARIRDLRRPPGGLPVATGRACETAALRVLTVGSDCNVGKMTTALEIVRELGVHSARARFVATGQTGMLIAEHGVAVDAVVADFIAGAVEALVIEAAAGADVVMVEGQGSLHHPGYSGVTLGLLHGTCPQALVLCHECGRERIRITGRDDGGPAIPPLGELRRAYETAAGWTEPARVVGVSLNTVGLDETAARTAIARAEEEVGVPATDPVRFGAGPLAAALARLLEDGAPRRCGPKAQAEGRRRAHRP